MKKILFIEDDENQRTLYREIFEKEGYEILLAKDGTEGLDIIEKTKVDLVITDLRMPKKDGLEAITGIIGRRKMCPIIIYTGYPQYEANFTSWAADAYLTKSGDMEELKLKIRELIGSRG